MLRFLFQSLETQPCILILHGRSLRLKLVDLRTLGAFWYSCLLSPILPHAWSWCQSTTRSHISVCSWWTFACFKPASNNVDRRRSCLLFSIFHFTLALIVGVPCNYVWNINDMCVYVKWGLNLVFVCLRMHACLPIFKSSIGGPVCFAEFLQLVRLALSFTSLLWSWLLYYWCI